MMMPKRITASAPTAIRTFFERDSLVLPQRSGSFGLLSDRDACFETRSEEYRLQTLLRDRWSRMYVGGEGCHAPCLFLPQVMHRIAASRQGTSRQAICPAACLLCSGSNGEA